MKKEVEAFINERRVRGWMPLSARKQVNVYRFFVVIGKRPLLLRKQNLYVVPFGFANASSLVLG
jgi:hypothetical protein